MPHDLELQNLGDDETSADSWARLEKIAATLCSVAPQPYGAHCDVPDRVPPSEDVSLCCPCPPGSEEAPGLAQRRLAEHDFSWQPERVEPPAQKLHVALGDSLTWWFKLACFNYTLVGLEMARNFGSVECDCASYPWRIEASLLLLQGVLSFLHDGYFVGRSLWAGVADRNCARFLTLCQPIKFAFCRFDVVQVAILLTFLTFGLCSLKTGERALAGGDVRTFQVFHTLWHIFPPLGGALFIEYTRLVLAPGLLESGACTVSERFAWFGMGSGQAEWSSVPFLV